MQRILLAIFLVFLPVVAGGGSSMTQSSIFWPTNGIGDGVATGYSSDQWQWAMRMMWLSDPTLQGVSAGYLNELAVTNPAGVTIRVASGGAIVYGLVYRNTSNTDLAVTTPLIDTTGWRLVLRADWEAQTVRAVLLESADGVAAIPAAVQAAGVTWDITLATGTVSVVPAVAITDARSFHLDDRRIANRTRKWFIPAVDALETVTGFDVPRDNRLGWTLADSISTECFGDFLVPEDFLSGMKIRAVVAGAVGNLYLENAIIYSAEGELVLTHQDTFGFAPVAIAAISRYYEVAEVTLGNAALGDLIGLRLIRDATDPLDTATGTANFKGWIIEYIADM